MFAFKSKKLNLKKIFNSIAPIGSVIFLGQESRSFSDENAWTSNTNLDGAKF